MKGAKLATVGLELISRIPNMRVLSWHGGYLYAGRGFNLVRWHPEEEGRWQHVATFQPGVRRQLSSSYRLGSRLFRDGFHAIAVLPDGGMVAALPKAIASLRPGERRFYTRFRIPRGTRPLALATTPRGEVYWGEYFGNPQRDAVHIYGSSDGGTSWEVVYTFPRGTIRHVHSITYDPYDDCLWVLTGDNGDECRMLRVSLDWSSVETVLRGNQQTRAVTMVPLQDALFFATDTPDETNYIYRLSRRGEVKRLSPIGKSCFWSCRAGEAMFFSTAVEPSSVNRDPYASLYGSGDGLRWDELVRWRRDMWPSRFFQYANIILPSGPNPRGILACTGHAVRGHDQVTHLWKVDIPSA